MSLRLDNLRLNSPVQNQHEGFSVTCHAGQFTVLLGRTGAGKTRLLRTVAGLEKPLSGRLILDDEDLSKQHPRQRSVAMVYQQFINYPHLSVYDNIASPLIVEKQDETQIKQQVGEVAELLQITPYLSRMPSELSGGQQQRCALARALVKKARVLLFDEPLVNLDAKLRETLRVELKSILAQRDCLAMYATTDPHEALILGGTSLLLDQGRLLQQGPALDTFYAPHNLLAANLLHEPPLNLFSVRVERSVATCTQLEHAPFVLPLDDGEYQLGVRADKLALGTVPDKTNSVSAAGKVTISEVGASESFVHLDTPAGPWVAHQQGIVDLPPDTELQIGIPLDSLYAFGADGATCLAPAREGADG